MEFSLLSLYDWDYTNNSLNLLRVSYLDVIEPLLVYYFRNYLTILGLDFSWFFKFNTSECIELVRLEFPLSTNVFYI